MTPEEALTFECSLDGDPFVTCASPFEVTALDPGLHTLEVRAIDTSNTADPTPAVYTWTVQALDVTAPDTNLVSGPPTSTTITTALTFECALDGDPFAACTSPFEVTALDPGLHTLEVRAIDASSTPDPSPAIYTWTVQAVDITAPNTTVLSGPAASTTSTTATFVFSASEGGATFECAVDLGTDPLAAFEACESPYVLNDLALGAHTFQVRATDAAGNTDASPAEYAWSVVPDTTAPRRSSRPARSA